MAYKAKYTLKRSVSSGTDEDTRAIVEAKFRFGDEVAPQDRETICSRFGINEVDVHAKNRLIVRYLQEVYGYEYSGMRVPGYYSRSILNPSERAAEKGIKRMYIKSHILRTGFDVVVKAHKPLPLEEMLNLEEINNLILTGKMPEKAEEK